MSGDPMLERMESSRIGAGIPVVRFCERLGVGTTTYARWRERGVVPRLQRERVRQALDELDADTRRWYEGRAG